MLTLPPKPTEDDVRLAAYYRWNQMVLNRQKAIDQGELKPGNWLDQDYTRAMSDPVEIWLGAKEWLYREWENQCTVEKARETGDPIYAEGRHSEEVELAFLKKKGAKIEVKFVSPERESLIKIKSIR
jgi:hypothetical protein